MIEQIKTRWLIKFHACHNPVSLFPCFYIDGLKWWKILTFHQQKEKKKNFLEKGDELLEKETVNNRYFRVKWYHIVRVIFVLLLDILYATLCYAMLC